MYILDIYLDKFRLTDLHPQCVYGGVNYKSKQIILHTFNFLFPFSSITIKYNEHISFGLELHSFPVDRINEYTHFKKNNRNIIIRLEEDYRCTQFRKIRKHLIIFIIKSSRLLQMILHYCSSYIFETDKIFYKSRFPVQTHVTL